MLPLSLLRTAQAHPVVSVSFSRTQLSLRLSGVSCPLLTNGHNTPLTLQLTMCVTHAARPSAAD